MIQKTQKRAAFTLVEMLVSTALIIFILVILSSVFTTGIGAMRSLRGIGHLQDHARYAVATLRSDLAAPHFGRETDALHGPNLSQQRLDLYDWTPPNEGFFRIMQMPELNPITGQPVGIGIVEGADADQLASTIASRHALHFTVRVEPNTANGSGRDQFFFTNSLLPYLKRNTSLLLPSTRFAQNPSHINEPDWHLSQASPTYYSAWAEVAYFLRESGQQAGSSRLYTLYRRRRVLTDIKQAFVKPTTAAAAPLPAKDSDLFLPINTSAGPGGLSMLLAPVSALTTDVSWYDAKSSISLAGTTPLFLNTPSNINVPYRRLGMTPAGAGKPPTAPAGLFAGNALAQPPLPSGGSYQSINDEVTGKNISSPSYNPGGDDILLENVLSFEIKATWDIPTDHRIDRSTVGVTSPTSFFATNAANSNSSLIQNSDYPFDNLPMTPFVNGGAGGGFGNDAFVAQPFNAITNPRVFDTWRGEDYVDANASGPQFPLNTVRYSLWNTRYETGQSTVPAIAAGAPPTDLRPLTIPLRIRVKAIQIRIRIWDTKTQQARQVTVVQDL